MVRSTVFHVGQYFEDDFIAIISIQQSFKNDYRSQCVCVCVC